MKEWSVKMVFKWLPDLMLPDDASCALEIYEFEAKPGRVLVHGEGQRTL